MPSSATFRDLTEHKAYQWSSNDPTVVARARLVLQTLQGGPRRKSSVLWPTYRETANGFAVDFANPASYAVAHGWFYRHLAHLKESDESDPGQWKVTVGTPTGATDQAELQRVRPQAERHEPRPSTAVVLQPASSSQPASSQRPSEAAILPTADVQFHPLPCLRLLRGQPLQSTPNTPSGLKQAIRGYRTYVSVHVRYAGAYVRHVRAYTCLLVLMGMVLVLIWREVAAMRVPTSSQGAPSSPPSPLRAPGRLVGFDAFGPPGG